MNMNAGTGKDTPSPEGHDWIEVKHAGQLHLDGTEKKILQRILGGEKPVIADADVLEGHFQVPLAELFDEHADRLSMFGNRMSLFYKGYLEGVAIFEVADSSDLDTIVGAAVMHLNQGSELLPLRPGQRSLFEQLTDPSYPTDPA